jgi:hypothetical protein
MTEKEKDLLLKDLCARSSYGVKIVLNKNVYTAKGIDLTVTDEGNWEYVVTAKGIAPVEIGFVKPYLRPMSSMSEDEKKSLEELCTMYNGGDNTDYESFCIEILQTHPRYGDAFRQNFTALDWLNSHHFDYRGLIQMGLALETPEGMYKIQ